MHSRFEKQLFNFFQLNTGILNYVQFIHFFEAIKLLKAISFWKCSFIFEKNIFFPRNTGHLNYVQFLHFLK